MLRRLRALFAALATPAPAAPLPELAWEMVLADPEFVPPVASTRSRGWHQPSVLAACDASAPVPVAATAWVQALTLVRHMHGTSP